MTALASVAAVGGPRPGAQVLVVAPTAGGQLQPLIAAQRYGQGRSLATKSTNSRNTSTSMKSQM